MESTVLEKAKDNISTLEINQSRLVRHLVNKESEFIKNIFEVANKVEPILNKISNIFPQYTLHDINHSIRIMEYMYDFINDINKISDLEVSIMIYSALLHDIGMYVAEDEIEQIKNDKASIDISYNTILRKNEFNDESALQEYIRRSHAERSGEWINKHLAEQLIIPSMPSINISEDVGKCCESHTQDSTWLKDKIKFYSQKGDYIYNLQYISLLLRLADILDIDSNRTPSFLYNLINPKNISDLEWKQHFVIHNRNKVIYENDSRRIELIGECDEPNIHRKVLAYIDWINSEIKNANILTKTMKEHYRLKIEYPLENKIEPKGYKFSDLKLNIDYHAVTELLMGEKIYGNRNLGLRELIQNSIDACKIRNEYEKKTKKIWENEYSPSIQVILYKESNQVIIKDNGIGMSLEVIRKYFLNIGVSYYKSDEFILKGLEYNPIGNFGIGFLSCFMLSDNVIIRTRYFNESNRYDIELNKDSQYICLNEVRNPDFQGTEIILDYESFISVFDNKIHKLREFIQQYFLTEGLKLKLIVMDDMEKSESYTNIISNEKNHDKTTHIIDVSQYLEGITGKIEIQLKKNMFGENVHDITKNEDTLYFDGKKLKKIAEMEYFDISCVLKDNIVNFIDAVIISHQYSYDYDKYYDVLDDEDESFAKIEDDLDEISILIGKDCDFKFSKYAFVKNSSDWIVDNLEVDELCDFGLEPNYPAKIYYKQDNIIYDHTNKKFVKVDDRSDSKEISNMGGILSCKIFLRNILVKFYTCSFLPILDSVKILNIELNVLNENIMTDISRNYLKEESKKILDYAIHKTIILWLIDTIKLNETEMNLIKSFKDKFYSENNILLKNKL